MTQFRDPQQVETDVAHSRIGALIDGRIKLEALLGEGAGSYVYRAHHALLGKKVAVKILKADLASDPRSLNRFMQEARTANGINHKNIARVTAFGVFEQTPYLVMDLLEGRTLQDALAARDFNINEGLRLVAETADALAHLHANGLVHRDIKPSNIMLVVEDGQEHAKLLDLGIVKSFETNSMHEFQQLTQTGTLVGTPMYMSPEQCTGKALDQRADIYSLGCVLFELVEGVAPYVGTNALETMFMHSNSPVPTLQFGSPRLKAVITKCLQKQAELRYQTGAELIEALRECPPEHGKSGPNKRKVQLRFFTRNGLVFLGLAVCIVASGIAAPRFFSHVVPKAQVLPAKPSYSGANLPLPNVKSADEAWTQLQSTNLDMTHLWQADPALVKHWFALCEAGLEEGGSPAARCKLANLACTLNWVLGQAQGPELSAQTSALASHYAQDYILQVLDAPENKSSIEPKALDTMLDAVLPILSNTGNESRDDWYDKILKRVPADAPMTANVLQLHYDRAGFKPIGDPGVHDEFKMIFNTLTSTNLKLHSDLLEVYSKYLSSMAFATEDKASIEKDMLALYQELHKLKPSPQNLTTKRPYTVLWPRQWAAKYCSTMISLADALAADPANKQLCIDTYEELLPIAQQSGSPLLLERVQLGPERRQ